MYKGRICRSPVVALLERVHAAVVDVDGDRMLADREACRVACSVLALM